MTRIILVCFLAIVIAPIALGYTQQSSGDDPKDSPAYEVLKLHRAQLKVDIDRLRTMFTEDWPETTLKYYELQATEHEMENLKNLSNVPSSKLSAAYGKLILRKVALETKLYKLSRSYTSDHPAIRYKKIELTALMRELEEMLK
jgi:hypothetical protein